MKKCRIIWYIETKWPSSSWIQPSSNKIFLLISIFFRADRSSRWFKGSYIAWLSKIRLSWFRMSRDYIQGVWSRSWRHPRWRLSCSMQSTNVVKKQKKKCGKLFWNTAMFLSMSDSWIETKEETLLNYSEAVAISWRWRTTHQCCYLAHCWRYFFHC